MLKAIVYFLLAGTLTGATGNVVYTGTPIGNMNQYGSALANAFDRDLTTESYGSNSGADHIGTDFGAGNSVRLSAYRVADSAGGYANGQVYRLSGAVIQGSNDDSNWTTLDTIPIPGGANGPYLARYTQASNGGLHSRNQRALSPGAAYRYYRFLQATTYGDLSELQWIGPAGSPGIPARPIMPVISPGAGAFPSGTATIAITNTGGPAGTGTTSAQIYYTTDGTTPTNTNGTLYSGPFTLSIGSTPVVLKAVAYDSSLSTALSDVCIGHFRNYAFKARDDWYDTDGILLGLATHITFVDGTYYAYGQFDNKGEACAPDICANAGVWMYSSSDLLNWSFVGQILDNGQSSPDHATIPGGEGAWGYVEGFSAIYNAADGNWVGWAHMTNLHDPAHTDRAGIAVTSGSDIKGPWSWVNVTYQPDTDAACAGYGDNNLFQDDDGTAYVLHVNGAQSDICIDKLSPDYKSAMNTAVPILHANREATSMFKRNGVYFMSNAITNYYDSITSSFGVQYMTCSGAGCPAGGTWSGLSNLFSPVPANNTDYNVPISSVFQVPGRQDGFIGIGYFFSPADLYASRPVWVPLTFPASTSVLGSAPAGAWDLSIFSTQQRLPKLFPLPSAVGK